MNYLWESIFNDCINNYGEDASRYHYVLSQSMKDPVCCLAVFHHIHDIYKKNFVLKKGISSFLNYYFQSALSEDIRNTYKILEQINDDAFTVKVLSESKTHWSLEKDIIHDLVTKHIITMAITNTYVIWAINNPIMTEDHINFLFDIIETYHPSKTYQLHYILYNSNIKPYQIDKLASLLKNNPEYIRLNHSMIWLKFLKHPLINSTIIANHLNKSFVKKVLQQRPEDCQIIADNIKNNSELEKKLILDFFPFLSDYGLIQNPLNTVIEVLEEVNDG